MTELIQQQFSEFMQEVLGAVKKLALEKKPLTPHAKLLIGPASFDIPNGIKSFNIINLGHDPGTGLVFSDIGISGITGITAIPEQLDTFAFSTENDQNFIVGPITITPAADHTVFIQYLK